MGKLNYLCLTLLCAAFGLSFTACSDDDDDTGLTMATIVGTWDAIWLEQNGDTIDVSSEDVYMTVNSDGTYVITLPNDKYEEGGTYINTYTGIYKIDGNTIVGFTADRGNTADLITEYYTFTSLDGTNASISYSNSTGYKYNFKAIKREDVYSE